MENDLEQPKIKKERSQKQIDAFKKAQQIRKDNAKIKAEKIAEIKQQYKGKQPEDLEPEPVAPMSTPKTKPKQVVQPKQEVRPKNVTQKEEEVTIVKKKKPRRKIVYESDSESDDEPPPPRMRKQVTEPEVKRYYPSNQRHTPYGIFAIV